LLGKLSNYSRVQPCSPYILRIWNLFSEVHFFHSSEPEKVLWDLVSYSLISMITSLKIDWTINLVGDLSHLDCCDALICFWNYNFLYLNVCFVLRIFCGCLYVWLDCIDEKNKKLSLRLEAKNNTRSFTSSIEGFRVKMLSWVWMPSLTLSSTLATVVPDTIFSQVYL